MAATATFTADFTRWNESLRDAQTRLKSFEVAGKGVQQQLARMATSFSGVAIQKQAMLAATAVQSIGGASKLTAEELKRFGSTIDAAIEKARRLGTVVPAAFTSAKAEIVAAENAMTGFSTRLADTLSDVGARATSAGRVLTAGLTAPLLGIGVVASKAAIDFESSFAGVRKTVQATESEFKDMERGFRDLAKSIPVSVNELNRLGEAAGALGVPKAEVVDFARVMALLGVTTNVTSDQAAESVAKIQNIFGAAGKETENFASTLVALGNAGASTEGQILEMATRIAGAGNVIGLTQGEVLGFASALASVGLEAEAGGSAISRVFVDMAAAVSGGGKALKQFADVAGQSTTDFAKLFKEDAAEAVTQFVEGLGRLKSSGGDVLKTLSDMGVTEVRLRDTLLRAAGAGDVLRESLELQAGAWQKNSALTVEANERFKTTASQLSLLGNRLLDVGITLGNALLPVIKSAVKLLGEMTPVIDKMVRGFVDLPGPVQMIAVGFAAALAAAGPLLLIFGQLATAASTLIGVFSSKGLATKALATEFTAATGAANKLTGALGTAGLVGAVVLVGNELDKLEQRTKEATDRAKEANATWGDLPSVIGNALARGLWPFAAAWRDITQTINEAKTAWDVFRGTPVALPTAPKSPALAIPTAVGPGLSDLSNTSKELNAIYKELAAGITSVGAAASGASGNVAGWSAELKSLGDRLAGFKDAIQVGVLSTKELSDEFGISEHAVEFYKKSLEGAANAHKSVVKEESLHIESMEAMRDQLAKVAAAFEKVEQAEQDASDVELFGGVTQQLDQVANRIGSMGDAFDEIVQAHDAMEDAIAKRTLSATDYQLRQIEKQRKAQLDALDPRAGEVLMRKATDAINLEAEDLTRALQHQGIERLLANKRELQEEADDARQTYEDMVRSHLFSTKEIERQMKVLSEKLSAIDDQIGKDWKSKVIDGLEAGLKQAATNIPGIILQGLTSGASFEDIATQLGTEIGGDIGGAIGFGLGGPLGEAIGKSVGQLLGPLLDKLIKTDAERALSEIGKEWGVEISEGLSEQIEKTMKTKFEGMRNNRWLAEVFNLGDIVKEVGITSDNIGELAFQLRQSFVFLSEGALSVSDTAHVLNESFNEFAKFYTDRNALLSREMVEIVALDRQLGVHSDAVSDFVKGQVSRSISGLASFTQERQKLIDGIAEARKAVDDLVKRKAGSKEIAEAKKQVQDLSKALSALPLSAQGAIGLGGAMAASFAELLRQGTPITEILRQIGPLAKSLGDQFAQAGVSGGAAFAEVLRLSKLAADSIAGPAIQAVADLNDTLSGLSNSGLLTQEIFTGLSTQVADTFAALSAQGKGGADALALMAPTLQTIWELQQDFGYAVDASTQALLSQAAAVGVVGDAHRSVEEQMLAATDRIATAVEGLARAFGVDIPAAAQAGADGVKDAFNGIPPEIVVPVTFPTDNIVIPPHPDSIVIRTKFPTDDLVIPDHPKDIAIPLTFPTEDIVIPPHPDDLTIPVDFPVPDAIAIPRHPDDVTIPVTFPTPRDIAIPPHPTDITIPVDMPLDPNIEKSIRTISAQSITAGEDISAAFQQAALSSATAVTDTVGEAISQIPEAMPAVRDRIIRYMAEAGKGGAFNLDPIADALKDLPDIARDAAGDIEGELRHIDIPDISIGYRYKLEGERPENGGSFNRPTFATGTPGYGFMDFGRRTTVDLHGREAVVRQDQRAAAAAAWGGGQSGPMTVNVYVQGTGYGDKSALVRDVKSAVIEGVQKNKDGSRTKLRQALKVP